MLRIDWPMVIALGNRTFMTCPSCHSQELHRSRAQGFYERFVLRVLRKYPYRCDECDFRFFAKRPKVRSANV
jgi:transposase-like protein